MALKQGMALVLLIAVLGAEVQAAAEPSQPKAPAVPVEEYPVYDRVVRSKFLTTGTTLVIIERMTTTQMMPDSPILPTVAFFEERAFFDSRLPRDLILDFLLKNRQPARLGNLFAFGAPYRFIASDGEPESEARLRGAPWGRPASLVQGADTIDRLAFSRVGFSPRLAQALVYVVNDRPDGSGAGFLIWLRKQGANWEIFDTEIVWTARSEPASAARP
jgi:hypothetical protein